MTPGNNQKLSARPPLASQPKPEGSLPKTTIKRQLTNQSNSLTPPHVAPTAAASPLKAERTFAKTGKSLLNTFKNLDFFGQTIDMNFHGNASYQTLPGAIMSLIIIILVASYGSLKFLQLVTFSQPDFVVNTVLKDLHKDYPEPFYA